MPTPRIDDPTGFEQWVVAGLKQRYASVLREAIPHELTALLGDGKATTPGLDCG